MSFEMRQGDVLEVLRSLPPNHFHSPQRKSGVEPNKRGFMGLEWDGCVPGVIVWRELLRTMCPGAHLLAFGGTRTHHRLMCAIEDSGFKIRDCLMWLHGQGFPKSANLGDGYGTNLKPAWEPIILAMKPLDGTFAQNAEKWGVAGIGIDTARIQTGTVDLGRWPANVLHDGSDEVLEHFPDAPGQLADVSTNCDNRKTQNVYGAMKRGNHEASAARRRNDSGSAARFFYCAKASKSERNGNTHPTVKPIKLTEYLAKLILPKQGEPRRIAVPFAGSGSEMAGCVAAGWDEVFGIERESAYVEFATKRVSA